MQRLAQHVVFCVLAALIAFPTGGAQQLPPAQVQRLLQDRPDLAATVRSRIGASGLTAEQIRARLGAAGYSTSLLDSYLPGSGGGAAAMADEMPPGDVLAAVRFLGLVDAVEMDSLRALAASRPTVASDSMPRDTTAGALPVFGLDVFRRATSQFEPALAGPVDESYRLGARDVLVLILTGGIEQSYTLEVTREGFVVIPQVGQLYVANLTLEQAEQLVYTRLRRVYSNLGRGPEAGTRFTLSVARVRANQVFVIGEVERPGSYQVSAAGTILTALYAAGGPQENGSLRQVEVRRGGRTVASLDVYDYLLRGDASRDVRLQTGDVIFVPVHGDRVGIEGEVVRPARYELRAGETLMDLVAAAGGFTAEAAQARVQIHRVLPPSQRGAGGLERVVLEVADPNGENGQLSPVELETGDLVTVFPVVEEVRRTITVSGSVFAPGLQGYSHGMRLSEALRHAGGVRPDVYLGQVLVARREADGSRRSIRGTFRDTTGALVEDLLLQEEDSIVVYARSSFRSDRKVVITGAVRSGGAFAYREGMTLRELVLAAGGLQDGAYLREAEIARLAEDRTAGKMATALRVPLDSSYLVDRRPADGGVAPLATRVPEVELQPYDNVLILRQPDWQLQRGVVVTGEVRFPGRYVLLSQGERISDLVGRAGGLTRRAYPAGVTFTRSADSTGRVGIDLELAMRDPRSPDNYALTEGDSIDVPAYSPVVKVTGAVNSPLAVSHAKGADVFHYVASAGGMGPKADRGRTYVVQPNGEVETYQSRRLRPDRVPKPRPGATIVVPTRDANETRDVAGMVASIAQVLTGVVAIVAVLAR